MYNGYSHTPQTVFKGECLISQSVCMGVEDVHACGKDIDFLQFPRKSDVADIHHV
jgi:hypothetical protein